MADPLALIQDQANRSKQLQKELVDVQRQQQVFNTAKDKTTDTLLEIEQAKNKTVQESAAFQAEQLKTLREAQATFREIEDGGFVAGIKEGVADTFGDLIPGLKKFSRAEQLRVMQRAQQDVALNNEDARLKTQQLESKANVARAQLQDIAADLDAEASDVTILRQRSKAALEAFQTETALKAQALTELPLDKVMASDQFTQQQKREEQLRRESKEISADMLQDQAYLTSQARIDRAKLVKMRSMTLAEKNEAVTKALENGGVLDGESIGLPGATFTVKELEAQRDETAQIFSNQELLNVETQALNTQVDATISTVASALGLSKVLTGGDTLAEIDTLLQQENLSVEDRAALERVKVIKDLQAKSALDAKTMKVQMEAVKKEVDGVLERQKKQKELDLTARKRQDELIAAEQYYSTGGIISDVNGAANVVEDALGSSTGNVFWNTVSNSISEILTEQGGIAAETLKTAGLSDAIKTSEKIALIAESPDIVKNVRQAAFVQGRFSIYQEVAAQFPDDADLQAAVEGTSEKKLLELLANRLPDGSDGVSYGEFINKVNESVSDFAERVVRPSGTRKYAQSGLNNIAFKNNVTEEFIQNTLRVLKNHGEAFKPVLLQQVERMKLRQQASNLDARRQAQLSGN